MAEAPGCHLHKSTEEVFPAHCCLTEVLGLTLGNGAGHSCARGRAGFYIMLMHSGTSGWENGSSPPPAAGEPPGNQLKCHTNPTANQRDGFRGIMVQISCSRGSTGHSVWGAALMLAWHCKGLLLLCGFALHAPPGITSDPTLPQPACKGNPGKFCTKTRWKISRKKVTATFTGFSRPEGTIMLI